LDIKKASNVALPLCEAEYVAISSAVCEAIWLRNLLESLNHPQEKSTVIHVYNKSTIKLSKNLVQHERSKYIDTIFHFLRDHVKEKTIELEYCNTKDQVVDIFKMNLSRCYVKCLEKRKFDSRGVLEVKQIKLMPSA
jgi:hypothetical protein